MPPIAPMVMVIYAPPSSSVATSKPCRSFAAEFQCLSTRLRLLAAALSHLPQPRVQGHRLQLVLDEADHFPPVLCHVGLVHPQQREALRFQGLKIEPKATQKTEKKNGRLQAAEHLIMLRREIEVETSELSESPLARDLGRILLVASVFAHPKPFCSPQWRPSAKTHRFGPILQKMDLSHKKGNPKMSCVLWVSLKPTPKRAAVQVAFFLLLAAAPP